MDSASVDSVQFWGGQYMGRHGVYAWDVQADSMVSCQGGCNVIMVSLGLNVHFLILILTEINCVT